MEAQTATKEQIKNNEEISIYAKVERKHTFDDGDVIYALRDVLGNQFDLKIWKDEAEWYECEVGEWYRFSNAQGDTFDEPMIDSNHGELDIQLVGNLNIDEIYLSPVENSRSDINDDQEIDILARIERVQNFENDDILCTATDINGNEFSVKIWGDEASKYKMRINQWYLFKSAKGDTFDEPRIGSNNGKMVEIPVMNGF